MERELLLLGMLRNDELYGYQINEMVEAHLGSSIHLTKPTTYRLLHTMTDDGLISYREEKEGKRPTRRVYSITRKGRTKFLDSLKGSLRGYTIPENLNAISLAFLGEFPEREARTLLEERIALLSGTLEEFFEDETQHGVYQLVIENQILHLSAELEWHKDLIERF